MTKYIKHLKTILRHKVYVFLACVELGIVWQGIVHDLSKFSFIEFFSSAKYFQGNRSPIDAEKEDKGYSLGWHHHKGHNNHHWEYWVDWNKGEMKPTKIPFKCCLEMLADYIGASRAYSQKKDIRAPERWWLGHKKMYVINKQTEKLLDFLMHLYANSGSLNLKKNLKKIKFIYENTKDGSYEQFN